MKRNSIHKWTGFVGVMMVMSIFIAPVAQGHCDTMNGPVVMAAMKALETGNVNHVLIWVQKKDEGNISDAFQQALKVRKLGPDAQKLADMYFFETLVRIHRAGEGVAYTGLKPAATEIEPGIAAADHAVESGSIDEVTQHLDEAIRQNLRLKFDHVMKGKAFNIEDIDAGREYVKAYVTFIHYVERLHQTATGPVEGHIHEAPVHPMED